MSTLQVTTITSSNTTEPLILRSANSGGGQIILNSANNDVQFVGPLRFTANVVGDGSGFTLPSSNVANAAFTVANAAFGRANTALQNTSGVFAGNLGMTGSLTLTGSVVGGSARTIPSTGGYFIDNTGINVDIVANGRTAGITGGWGSLRVHQNATFPGLKLVGDTSQTANYMEVESSTDGSIFRIASNGRVGIGTSTPSSALHVAGGAGSTIRNAASSGSSWFVGTNIDSYILHNESNTPMIFTTNGTERMRIDSSGRVGIGNSPFQYSASSGLGAEFSVQSSSTTNAAITIQAGLSRFFISCPFNSNVLEIGGNGGSYPTTGSNGPKITIATDGVLNIKFSPNQAASSDANTLDDYEEGSWTPRIDSNNGQGTFTTRSGWYVKIGRRVTAWFVVDGGSSLAAGTTQYVTGLPFSIFSSYSSTHCIGQMGTNGPTIRTQQLMTLSANRGVAYVYSGGNQETTTITFATGVLEYLTDS